jgi:cation diffusion facilitator CzcD-associated flavoprotein CzcO
VLEHHAIDYDAVIVGAGHNGLVAAHELLRDLNTSSVRG